MKNKWVLTVSALAAFLAMPAVQSAAETAKSSESSLEAPATPVEIKRTAASLDDLLNPIAKKVVFDGNGHSYKVKAKPVDPDSFLPILSDLVKADQKAVSKALSQKYHLSDIVFASLMAEQSGRNLKQSLSQKSPDQWIKDLQKASVPLQEAQDRLNIAYVELAFVALDRFDEGRAVGALPKE